jgi:hypothetical protein
MESSKFRKFLVAMLVGMLVLLLLIAFWTFSAYRTTRQMQQEIRDWQAVEGLRLFAELLRPESDCGSDSLYDDWWYDSLLWREPIGNLTGSAWR